MKEVYIDGQRFKLDPNKILGKGGEAEVYDLGNDEVLKIFKTPDHPDLAGNAHEQQGAIHRIAQHQVKLKEFPSGLPERVISPRKLATDRPNGKVVGFTMRKQKGTELRSYSKFDFRKAVGNDVVLGIFADLHGTVNAVHKASVVIGDFNDLNVMVDGSAAFLLDADSMQFGKFMSMVFTDRFVDPSRCDPASEKLMLAQPHNVGSDWYAFSVMLFQCLLLVDPYGGVYRPKPGSGKPMVTQPKRPMKRITVFDPDVIYPKAATHYRVLPDDLLHYYHALFEKDARGEFPLVQIKQMRWTECSGCGLSHARSTCPTCAKTAPAAVVQTVQVRGKVTATKLFSTVGVILRSAMQGDKFRYLYHEGGAFKRETGKTVMNGDLDAHMRYRVRGDATVFGKDGRVAVVEDGKKTEVISVDSYGLLPVFDTNQDAVFWTQGGLLQKSAKFGSENLGDVMSGHTLFWVGPKFGFGFYRAGQVNVGFVFNTATRALNDSVKLPKLTGKLVEANAIFSNDRCWFLVATQENGKTIHRAVAITAMGAAEAAAEAEAGDGSWLGTLANGCAAGNSLLMPTDEGIVRIDAVNGQLVKTKEFPDTEPFVDTASRLHPGTGCLLVVGKRDIYSLKIAPGA